MLFKWKISMNIELPGLITVHRDYIVFDDQHFAARAKGYHAAHNEFPLAMDYGIAETLCMERERILLWNTIHIIEKEKGVGV